MINITCIYIDKEIENEVKKVLTSGLLVQGKKVNSLEKKLCKINGSKYAIVVNSGTAALHTALSSIGVGQGDEVITSPFSFIATVNSILMCGAKPVFVDIDYRSFNINPDLIESKITTKTKAILTVDLYGQSCDYQKIREIAKKHNLKMISDSAQAIGAKYKNKPVSKWVDICCFSFYATKNIMMGEGGALVTSDKKIYEYAKRFRQHGQDMEKPYIYHHLGYNYRCTDILAAIGLAQIKNLDKWTSKRYQNAKKLISKLQDIPGIVTPLLSKGRGHVFHQFTIRVEKKKLIDRDKLQLFLLKNGVKSGVYYPSILAQHKFVKKITPFKKGMYKEAEKAASEVLSLPVHPMLSNSEIDQIGELIKKGIHEKI